MSNKDVNCTFDSEEMYESFDHMEGMIGTVVADHKLPELASKTLLLAFKKIKLSFEKCDLARKKAEQQVEDLELDWVDPEKLKEVEIKLEDAEQELSSIEEDSEGTSIVLKDLTLAEQNRIEEFLETMFPNSNDYDVKVSRGQNLL